MFSISLLVFALNPYKTDERTYGREDRRTSLDINHVDYVVWGALQQDVYRVSIVGLEDLKDRVRTC